MPGMTGGFLKKVHQDPTEVHRCFVAYIPAMLTKALCGCHDGISAHPSLLIDGDGGLHVVFWPELVILDDAVLTGEAMK